ncbi:MAG: archaeal proteasome endopeptidase complex subunit beta [Candidatus Micrarchaeia archaeon]
MEAKKGTTTVGLICSDGIVFAADRRASMGYFIANRETPKIFQIDERLAMTVAGMVADAQTLVRVMRAEAALYRLQNGKPMSVQAATTLLANILFQYKLFPFYVQLLMGGYDDKPRIFNLDPLGGVTEEKFVATGSGSPIVYGLLEEAYREDRPIKDNLRLAVKCISVATKRDCATGDGLDLVAVHATQGFKQYAQEEIRKLME